MTDLRQRQCSSKINEKILLEVAHSNGRRVHNEITTAKNSRIRGDKSGAKLHGNVKQREEIDNGAEESDDDTKASVETHTTRAADDDKVKVKRVDEESKQTGNEKNEIPSNNKLGIGF